MRSRTHRSLTDGLLRMLIGTANTDRLVTCNVGSEAKWLGRVISLSESSMPTTCPQRAILLGRVHLRHVVHNVVQGRRVGWVDGLLALGRTEHDCVMRLQRPNVVCLAREGALGVANGLDALAEAVLGNEADDLLAVLLLCVDPACHLVDAERRHGGRELIDLHHCLGNRGDGFLDLHDKLGVVKDAAGNGAVAAAEPEHEVES
mmetsp:Transcript_2963/g.6334  ORF Transcript_2963/g.6334 Transcript_2963/m.6334 type:complete len:204 (-) Transcript_2963:23-634(-)